MGGTRPLPYHELVQRHGAAQEAWLFADLAGQGDDFKQAVKRRHQEIVKAIVLLGDPLPVVEQVPEPPTGGWPRNSRLVLKTCRGKKGGSITKLGNSAERALAAVRAFDREHTALLATMETGLDRGLPESVKVQGFYAARSRPVPPLPWPAIAPPLTPFSDN